MQTISDQFKGEKSMEIAGKVILITGSAHRVGRTIALTLAEKKARIVIHYNTRENEAKETLQTILNNGGEAIIVHGNVSKKQDWIKWKSYILKKWGTIDVLVNNAAIFYKTPVFDISEDDWDKFLDINLKGVFWGCQIMGQEMFRKGSGKIINITDVSADTIWPSYIPYCVSKAGVVALTKGLAKALAPHVMVNAVAPGTVLLAEEHDEEEENALIKRTPLKCIGSAEDIASAVSFLIEGSDYITGTTIKVDGGRSLT